ncbi:hypothetical protein RB195_016730 [Necator americanus]|uniref:Prenyltransferase alpha-alpha toroid domain-containing protein n=1 Tax=Necator americanus TaxID=51031 RepID=A0ABR1C1V1_NECAM
MSNNLILQKHVKFLIRHLNVFPEQYCSLDTNRVTLLFFALSALDLIGELDGLLKEERRKSIIDWIYKLQITSSDVNATLWIVASCCGSVVTMQLIAVAQHHAQTSQTSRVKTMKHGAVAIESSACMAALYCEPKLIDFGLVGPCWRAFGGFMLDPKSGREIPQYNLAAFWKRPIAPIVTGFAEQIVTRRPPGNFRCDVDSIVFNNVNLLAATRISQLELRLWTVPDSHNQSLIHQFGVKVNNGILLSEGELQHEFNVGDPVMELRLVENDNRQLWVRCKGHLNVLEPSTAASSRVFRNSVRSFEECKTLPGDLVLCDMAGMVWNGVMGTPLSRIKTSNADEECVTYTDHPRVVLTSSSYEVRNLDLRMYNISNTTVLFDVPEFAKKSATDSALYVPDKPVDRAHICHLRTIPEHRHNFYVLTTHSAYLCDDRFPRNAVLTLPHSIPYGAHVLQPTMPQPDPCGTGDIVSIYFLDHLLSGIWVSRLYRHACEIWSSVLPIHQMEDCWSLDRVVKPSTTTTRKRPKAPVMGMAIVQDFKDDSGRVGECLLSSLNDGSVWYQSLRYGSIQPAELRSFRVASQERIEMQLKRSEESELDQQQLPESLRRPLSSSCTTLDIELEQFKHKTINKPWNPLRKRINKKCEPIPIMQPSSSEAVLPRVVTKCCGFRGTLGFAEVDVHGNECSVANLAQTYSGLLCLAVLGDNFQNINKEAILESVRCSQKEDGSFWSEGYGSESDMRFVFCAVAICHILQDNSYINWTSLKKFVRSSLNYDGGIGQGPGDESHGGSTFCAIASLSLSNRLWDGSILSRNEISRLVKWALWKQNHGFHGRAHKDDDSCYAFWIGATLEILNASHLMDQQELRSFLLTAQHQPLGGFCKVPDPAGFPDLLHTYFSLAAFSLLREPGFSPIHASLNVSKSVYEHILKSTKCDISS